MMFLINSVTGSLGIKSFELDLNGQKLIITGDIDPVEVVGTLRKHWYAEIVSFGPPLEKKTEESKTDDEPKKEDAKNDDDERKKIDDAEHIADQIMASNNYYPNPYHPCVQPNYYYYVPQQQYPNTCAVS